MSKLVPPEKRRKNYKKSLKEVPAKSIKLDFYQSNESNRILMLK
jgi:hypothetical protein